jgi:hypothetical protein
MDHTDFCKLYREIQGVEILEDEPEKVVAIERRDDAKVIEA